MSKFLVTYHGGGMPSDPAQIQQIKVAFGKWLEGAGKAVVDPGAPVRPLDRIATGTPVGEVPIGGYSIIEASTLEKAVEILRNHPFVARGGTLQVSECLVV